MEGCRALYVSEKAPCRSSWMVCDMKLSLKVSYKLLSLTVSYRLLSMATFRLW